MEAGQGLRPGAVDEQGGGAAPGEADLGVDVALGGQDAGAGLERAAEQVQRARSTVRVVPAAMVSAPPRTSTASRVWEPVIVWVPVEDERAAGGGQAAGGVGPVAGRAQRAGDGQRAGRLVDVDVWQRPPPLSCGSRSRSGRRVPLISRVAVPPPVKPAVAVMSRLGGQGAGGGAWLSEPLVRVRVPPAVSVVPAAMVTVPAISTASRVWLPVMVRVPANWMLLPVDDQAAAACRSSCGWCGSVPLMVSVPDGLAMFDHRQAARRDRPRSEVWGAPLPLMSRVAVPPVKPLWASMFALRRPGCRWRRPG